MKAAELADRQTLALAAAYEVEEIAAVLPLLEDAQDGDVDKMARVKALLHRRLMKLSGIIMSCQSDDDTVPNIRKRLADEVIV